ncbi:copper-binding protein [Sagittula sp. P11]|uniref:copper chaperone PCu(A)C n=1 Tax=Sagittula sp. P11 TaxID=2009329 RepID=UPI000C2D571D|nr:copper chaperone PCu(A)C [Sagittula sp. P11]AUC54324.1 copper-binding protein [Sagittula sp. P11]
MMKSVLAGAVALILATPVFADIEVVDAYARAASPTAKAGAAFMVIRNTGSEGDRLIAAASDIAARVELHTHKDMGEGVMKMMHVEEGFAVPAGDMHALARGGDHVMFMGLTRPMAQGDTVTVTLTFEKAGEVVVDIPVDLEREDMGGHGAGMSMGN